MKKILLIAIVLIGAIIILYMFRKELGIEKYFPSSKVVDNTKDTTSDVTTVQEKAPVWGSAYDFDWMDLRNSMPITEQMSAMEKYNRFGILSKRDIPLRINDYVKIVIKTGNSSYEGIYKVYDLGWGTARSPFESYAGSIPAPKPQGVIIPEGSLVNKKLFRINVRTDVQKTASTGTFYKLMNKEELTDTQIKNMLKK